MAVVLSRKAKGTIGSVKVQGARVHLVDYENFSAVDARVFIVDQEFQRDLQDDEGVIPELFSNDLKWSAEHGCCLVSVGWGIDPDSERPPNEVPGEIVPTLFLPVDIPIRPINPPIRYSPDRLQFSAGVDLRKIFSGGLTAAFSFKCPAPKSLKGVLSVGGAAVPYDVLIQDKRSNMPLGIVVHYGVSDIVVLPKPTGLLKEVLRGLASYGIRHLKRRGNREETVPDEKILVLTPDDAFLYGKPLGLTNCEYKVLRYFASKPCALHNYEVVFGQAFPEEVVRMGNDHFRQYVGGIRNKVKPYLQRLTKDCPSIKKRTDFIQSPKQDGKYILHIPGERIHVPRARKT